jgi:signal transduction histidine kinase
MLIAFFVLIAVDLGVLFLLERQTEREFMRNESEYREMLTSNSPYNVILTGDLQSSFYYKHNVPEIEARNLTAASIGLHKQFRNRVFLLFGTSLLLGIGFSLYLARRVAQPILQLAHNPDGLTKQNLKEKKLLPECIKISAITDMIQNMKEEFIAREEENSRQKSVEITKNLAAGVAHEIKNPINTVGLTVEYLQTNLSPENPEKRYEFFKLSDNMKDQLKRINRIVEGFLRLTKPSVYNFEQEDINSLIRETVTLYEPEIVKEGIQIQMELAEDLPSLRLDRDKINQVFSNLILNAIEAMPRGGNITIQSTRNNNSFVEVRVADNGIGIGDENVNDIFSPYYTTKKQGFGLGLSLTHSIIHKHRGRVTVSSEKGVGTQFTVLLPVDEYNE